MFPPVAAARSTVTLPTFIDCTIGWMMDALANGDSKNPSTAGHGTTFQQ